MPHRPPREVSDLLRAYENDLRRALETHLPRTLTPRVLRRLLGPARYAYDRRALQRAIADPVWELLDRGGKRWRPVLFLLILRLFGKHPRKFLDAAAVFELIHTGTLIVDDVEDGSLLRRGGPALHRIVGTDIAVNAGNSLYFIPLLHLLDRRGLSSGTKLALVDICIRDLVRLHAGQGTDIVWHRGLVGTKTITERQYLQMCAYKTGCLSRMAATAAAIIGSATPKQRNAVAGFAETLGVVFQIQDDLLNIRDSALSRKKGRGEDITEGKRSLAVIHALRTASRTERKRLLHILALHTDDQRLRDEAIGIIEKSGGVKRAQHTMERLFRAAWKAFDRALPASPAKKDIERLANFLIERDV